MNDQIPDFMTQQPQAPINPPNPPQSFSQPQQTYSQPAQTYSQPQALQGNGGPVISVRLAAIEVWRKEKLMRMAMIGAICGFFMVMIGAATNMYVGLIMTMIFCAAAIFLLYKSNTEVNRLQQKYGIDPKAN